MHTQAAASTKAEIDDAFVQKFIVDGLALLTPEVIQCCTRRLYPGRMHSGQGHEVRDRPKFGQLGGARRAWIKLWAR